MAAETPKAGGAVRQDAPVSDAENGAQDPGRSSADHAPRTKNGAARDRVLSPHARPEPQEPNSIRARRVRARMSEEPRAGAPSTAKRASDPKSVPEAQS